MPYDPSVAKTDSIYLTKRRAKSGGFAVEAGGAGKGMPKIVLRDPPDLIKIVVKGAPVADAGKLIRHFNIERDVVETYLSGTPVKFKRREASGRFSREESERLVRFARLMGAAEELHDGDADAARRWMQTPKPALGGATPLEYAKIEVGAREVEHLIGRLEHGVFS